MYLSNNQLFVLFVKRPIVDIKYNSTKNFLYIII